MENRKNRSVALSKRNPRKTLEQAIDSSSSRRFLSILRSKLVGGRNIKSVFRNIRKKRATGETPQARVVKCPNCRKILKEPDDVPVYRCGGCDTVLQAKRWNSEGKVASSLNETDAALINDKLVPKAILLSSGERHSRAKDESADLSTAASGSNKSPRKKTYRHVYNAEALSSGERDDHLEAVYAHERSIVPSEATRNWVQEYVPQVPLYPMSPSPSSACECASPFHSSCISTSEQAYYHQWNDFRQYGRQLWSGESSVASPRHFSGETSDVRYYHLRGQSPLCHFQYRGFPGYNFCESHSSCTATPLRSAYPAHCSPLWSPKIESSSQKDVNSYVRERIRPVKRHVLPSAGGAPFVMCYYCLELLQLPQGFLCGKQKSYTVRCGSCFGLLKFSLQEKTRGAPRTRGALNSVPSNHSTGNVISHQDDEDSASVDHEEGCPDKDAVSCSDNDSGDSVCKSSLSADSELFSLEFFRDIGGGKDTRKIFNGSSEAVMENEMLRENPRLVGTVGEISGFHLEHSQDEIQCTHLESSQNVCENSSKTLELDKTSGERYETRKRGKMGRDGSGASLEHSVGDNEKMSKTQDQGETFEERRLVSHSEKPLNDKEISSLTLEMGEDKEERNQSGWLSAPISRAGKFDSEDSKEGEYASEILKSDEAKGDIPGLHLEEYEINYENSSRLSKRSDHKHKVSRFHAKEQETLEPCKAVEDRSEFSSWGSPNDHESSSIKAVGRDERTMLDVEESVMVGENETKTLGIGETAGGRPKFSIEESFEQENMEERHQRGWFSTPSFGVGSFDFEESREQGEYSGEVPKFDETMGDKIELHMEEDQSNYENSSRPFKWSDSTHSFSSFRAEKPETESSDIEETLEPRKVKEERSEFTLHRSLYDQEISSEAHESDENRGKRPMFHQEKSPMMDENESQTLKINVRTGVRPNFSSDESLEQENATPEGLFHLEVPEDEQEDQRRALKPCEAKEETSAFCSELSLDSHVDSRLKLESDGEAAEEKLGEHKEHEEDEHNNAALPFEPYAHIYAEIDPSEIVGLRQALYPTQSSPLRSPLSSPLHTPIGSPLRYPMGSPLRSPAASTPRCNIVSPMRSPIVSPVRSPISSPLSLHNALSLSK